MDTMQQQQHPITSIKTRHYRRRQVARALLARHSHHMHSEDLPQNPIKVVCISDTHNTKPVLPPGDVLIHAGDLTEHGSFDEVQVGLEWLSSQPHRFKILIAGNHDVLFDEDFLEKYPERRYGETRTKQDLHWGDVIYLQDTSITLNIPIAVQTDDGGQTVIRKVTIFGSPWTPQYGISAFQYEVNSGQNHWSQRLRIEGRRYRPDVTVMSLERLRT
ncbi:hypothetical protein QBC35DRAFT_273617 [Podospora australis]|uniref:Calcineurin-like phosphoesterase domain-containing protein n=1 Tax=Podospora australis TaxID=1536484 RepID=A0AAN7AGZ8_9PEZI|nr:hypothetical protein QBC35DRAFT_273617 [Podospora australis]